MSVQQVHPTKKRQGYGGGESFGEADMGREHVNEDMDEGRWRQAAPISQDQQTYPGLVLRLGLAAR